MRNTTRDDRGISLPEILVTMVILTVVIGVGTALVAFTGRIARESEASVRAIAQLEDASTQLMRDVQDARRVLRAEPGLLQLEVVRNGASDGAGACVLTTWQVTGTGSLDVTRVTFEKTSGPGDAACASSGGQTASKTVVQGLEEPELFAYFSSTSSATPLPVPVATDEVARVTWTLTTTPTYPDDAEPRTVTSGASLAQRTGTSGVGEAGDARAPLLSVVTTHEGVGAPQLRWTDPTPTMTKTWTVYRIAYPEGSTASGTWQALITLPGPARACSTTNPPTQQTHSYTDTALPAGHTGRYIVRATLCDGPLGPDRPGPTSNQVVTGMRPAATTLTATGQATSIRLDWAAAVGATHYDLYRDGTLYQRSLTGTTWTDNTGRGHAHHYRIVPVNRWERCATAAARCTEALQSYQVGVGASATTSMPAGSPTAVRLLSSGNATAWSSPVAPTNLQVRNRQPSNVSNPSATWDATVDITWTASAWTGSASSTARTNTRYHVSRAGTQFRSNLNATTTTDTGAARGSVLAYVVTPVTLAPHALTGQAASREHTTWPAAPTCSITLGTAGYPGTRAARLTVNGPSGQNVTARRVYHTNTGSIANGNASDWVSLTHDTNHSWRGQAQNAGGYGPWGASCTVRTLPVRVSIVSASAPSTRRIVATASATNGTSRTMTIEGVTTQNGTNLDYNFLTHNRTYRVTARNTDGLNTVTASRNVGVPELTVATPARPSCNAWSDGPYAPTTVRFSSNASLNRTAAVANTPGYYSATATATNTRSDGWNTVSRSSTSSCGVTVAQRPWTQIGQHGSASPICAPYRAYGSVINSLDVAWNNTGSPAGTVIAGPISGAAADYGQYIKGSYATQDLSCSFFRSHDIVQVDTGWVVGVAILSIRWNSHGMDAH